MQGARERSTLQHVAPGSLVVVRDEEWLVTQVSQTRDGTLITCQGLSELVAGATAQFSEALDTITPFDPRATKVVADSSRNHQRARLWLEATLRKTPLPIDDRQLAVSGDMLVDPLDYQRAAVAKALDPETLRPRILLAEAVGLGKTLEIGMILSELVRRGRGDRILVVTPRHVLEQMQHELWCRFALPFVRLDSVGIQRLRRCLPGMRWGWTTRTRSPTCAPRTTASPHRPARSSSSAPRRTTARRSRSPNTTTETWAAVSTSQSDTDPSAPIKWE